jgi:hypothetical protein
MSLLRSNLLQKALRLIPGESFQYLKFLGEQANAMGIKVPTYATPITVFGSVQSPENSLYQQLGLDLDKNYKLFYGSTAIKGNETQPQPDKFIYEGKTFETVRNSDWFTYDGWCGVLAVEIKRDRNNGD